MTLSRTFVLCASLALPAFVYGTDHPSFQSPFGFDLEESTLDDVQRKFGDAEQFEISEGHHEFGICYETTDSEAIVVFSSNAEFGGPDKLLLGIAIYDAKSESLTCSSSTMQSSDLVVGELKLGMTLDDFQSLSTDEARSLENGYFDYDLEFKRALTDSEKDRLRRQGFAEDMPDGIYVGLSIWCRIADEHATEVGVWQISTF